MLRNLPESELIKIFQNQLPGKKGLVTEEGEPLQIIYPGRINGGQGPDFKDAVIITGNKILKGHIEVHIKSSSWYEHRHHQDKAYNQVIMHVVMWHNDNVTTVLENGKKIPLLALYKFNIETTYEEWSDLKRPYNIITMPCRRVAQHPDNRDIINESLDKTGEDRFFNKVSSFRADFTEMEADESLYRGIMGALGYSRNKQSFIELAHHLPLKTLTEILNYNIPEEECLTRQQSLLLGTSGLLPSQYENSQMSNKLNSIWINKLETLWKSYNQNYIMPSDSWYFCNIRPGNSPILRLLAISFLLLRYRQKGLLEGLTGLIRESFLKQDYHKLQQGLIVDPSDYESGNYSPALFNGSESTALLGRNRADDIIINILLPFSFAWGNFTSQPELEWISLEFYRHYPKLATNTIERHMIKQLGLENRQINSARRQQGLIRIYKNFCTEGKCNDCLLSQLEVGNYVYV